MKKYTIGPSKIQGRGVIATQPIQKGEMIDLGIEYSFFVPKITPYFGSMINHSWTPSCFLKYYPDSERYYVHALHPLNQGDEITVDYRKTPWFIARPDPNWK